ncbi:TetR/AcrR family transcriptional regulator [Mycolicibacterium lutetiense]
MNARKPSGTWGGRTADQRRAERRQRIIETAIDLWRESGWPAVSIRGICARTGLNDRYFYEAFTDRDALLVAAWHRVLEDTLGEVADAFARMTEWPTSDALREAISIVVERIFKDPARAQILLVDHAGNAALHDLRGTTVLQAADFLIVTAKPRLDTEIDEDALRIDTFMAIAGFIELINATWSGALELTADQIVDHVHRLGIRLAERYLPLNG